MENCFCVEWTDGVEEFRAYICANRGAVWEWWKVRRFLCVEIGRLLLFVRKRRVMIIMWSVYWPGFFTPFCTVAELPYSSS